jgi:hypothetical protein
MSNREGEISSTSNTNIMRNMQKFGLATIVCDRCRSFTCVYGKAFARTISAEYSAIVLFYDNWHRMKWYVVTRRI